MGNVAEGLHFLEKWGKFFIFLKILMKFGLKMCNYPLNMMVGYFPDSKVGFGSDMYLTSKSRTRKP